LIILEEAWPFASVASEITYRIQDEAFDYLDAPIKRITTADTPAPYSPVLLEKWIPNANDIVTEVKDLLNR
jgi:pyruvate dehydrogenase E1 component beta subunit